MRPVVFWLVTAGVLSLKEILGRSPRMHQTQQGVDLSEVRPQAQGKKVQRSPEGQSLGVLIRMTVFWAPLRTSGSSSFRHGE